MGISRVLSKFSQNHPSREATRAIWKTLKIPVKLILNCLEHLRLFVYHMNGKIIEGFIKLWYFVAFKLLIFSSRFCPLLENVSPVRSVLLFVFLFSLVFLGSSINSSSVSRKR